MSDFVQQKSFICSFNSNEGWVILSPIELSIKHKVDSIGIPLKDWSININYGIKTGFNAAFIINSNKRQEILRNCKTEKERQKTAELIRPILRGRDIKRYSYEYADLYLIATFPSKNYNIEDYPEVKKHLLSFGKERLEQTGKKYLINGEEIKARKKTNNKWFETQDSISYWEEFNKPKIVWKRVGSIIRFSFDTNKCMTLDSTCFAVGEHIKYLVAILNSKFGNYLLQDAPKTGTGDLLISVQAVEPLMIPIPNKLFEDTINKLLDKILTGDKEAESEINRRVYNLYGLSDEEIDFIQQN